MTKYSFKYCCGKLGISQQVDNTGYKVPGAYTQIRLKYQAVALIHRKY